nr:UvrD-helicase domain-containing protein [Arenimonas sp.]
MTDAKTPPLPYRLDLSGLSLIEASAGTGKTYTLVRLMARHLLWHGLPIERILAVTFTEVACSELKDRLRTFLAQVTRYLACETEDGDIQYLLSGRPEHVSDTQFKAWLLEALDNIDRAAIFTIHGFCQGILRDQPLLAGQTIPAPELLLNEAALYQQISEEFWRRHGQNPETASALQSELQSPQQTVSMLPNLLSLAQLKPDKPELPDPAAAEPMPDLAETVRLFGQQALQAMLLAFEAGVFHKNQFPSAESIQSCFARLAAFLNIGDIGLIDKFSKLAYSRIREIKGKSKPDNPLLHHLDRLLAWQAVQNENQQRLGLWLLHELQIFARQRLAELKRQRQVIGFSDMIDSLYFALHAEHGEALAEGILEAFPVALVDEFQDTDERQWAIFEQVYRKHTDSSMILIGDPKQAIYGFRGGDVHTYLKARAQTDAERIHCLEVNFRSSPELLAGIERVFSAKRSRPFYEPAIQFTPVKPGRNSAAISVDGEPWPALQFALLERGRAMKPLPAGRAALRCADLAAASIAQLLNQAQRNKALLTDADGTRPVSSRDIVVLVASHRQAALMQSR